MPRLRKRKSSPPPPPTALVLSGTLSTASARGGEPVLLIAVRCPHCRSQHVHTWAPTATGPFHRAAHCADGSPLRSSGYYVECPDTAYNAAIIRQFARMRSQWEAAGRRRGPRRGADLAGAPLAEVAEVLRR